jgi:hypothetical protein
MLNLLTMQLRCALQAALRSGYSTIYLHNIWTIYTTCIGNSASFCSRAANLVGRDSEAIMSANCRRTQLGACYAMNGCLARLAVSSTTIVVACSVYCSWPMHFTYPTTNHSSRCRNLKVLARLGSPSGRKSRDFN